MEIQKEVIAPVMSVNALSTIPGIEEKMNPSSYLQYHISLKKCSPESRKKNFF
jgi:hypothetical protein